MTKLGERIKARRKEQERTLSNLAWYVQTSKGYLSDIENGKVKNPGFRLMCGIAQVLDIRLDELAEIVLNAE